MSCCSGRRGAPPPPQVSKAPAEPAAVTSRGGGMMMVSTELAAERLAICQTCEHKRDTPVMYCTECGCALTLKTKLKIGKCPIGKW